MRLARVLRQRFRSIFRPSQVEHDLEQELAIHLDQLTKEYRAAGMSESDARNAAHRVFGPIAATADQCRDTRRLGFLEDTRKDLGYAFRVLAKSPVFTATAVLSLALGIGANTATFGIIDALTLRTLPVRNPQRLVMLFESGPDAPRPMDIVTSYQRARRYGGLTGVFEEAAAISLTNRSNIGTSLRGEGSGAIDTGQVRVALISGNYFAMLGVGARFGRVLTPDDDRAPGGHPVAVISHAYWERRFASSPEVLGGTLGLNGITYTIVGVAAQGFSGEWVGRPVDLWIPTMMQAQIMLEFPTALAKEGSWVRVLARLKPDVTLQQAQAAAEMLYQENFRESWPHPTQQQAQFMARSHVVLRPAGNGFSPERDSLSQSLTILMSVAGLVLLIACANVANLLLARAAARRRETAVRLAIGAGRGRIVRQLLTESVLLAAMGGLAGFLFSVWGTRVMALAMTAGPVAMDSRVRSQSLTFDLHPDWRVFAFAAALCLLTGVLFGLAPAIRSGVRSANASLVEALAERGPGGLDGGRLGLAKLLVISQVALSLMLLMGAGLFVRTLRNLRAQDLGMDRKHVLLVWTTPGQTGRQGAALANFVQIVQERLSAVPGVLSASMSNHGPLEGGDEFGGMSEFVKIPGQPPKPGKLTMRVAIAPGFFEAAGMPLLAGRGFTERDADKSPLVVVINESMTRFFFGDRNPVGQHLAMSPIDTGFPYEIVGVVADAKHGSPRDKRGIEYVPYRQVVGLMRTMCIELRAAGPPAGIAARVRQELRAIDPNLPILRIDTLEEQLDDVLAQERLIAGLSVAFGAVATLLACLGLYGVMSYMVVRRTNEIGIRMALGARRGDVLSMILKETLLLVLAGTVIGVPSALMATRLVANRLFGVSAGDSATIGCVVLLMSAVAALAGFLPAQRAAQVDPLVALRHE
jgi:predicted permease